MSTKRAGTAKVREVEAEETEKKAAAEMATVITAYLPLRLVKRCMQLVRKRKPVWSRNRVLKEALEEWSERQPEAQQKAAAG